MSMNEDYDYEKEQINKRKNNVDTLSQLSFAAQETFSGGKKRNKSDIDAINNRNKLSNNDNNENNLLGVVNNSNNSTSLKKKNSLSKKNSLEDKNKLNKKQGLENNKSEVSKEDKDMLSSKKNENNDNNELNSSKNAKTEEQKKEGNKLDKKEETNKNKKRNLNPKANNSKIKGKASFRFKMYLIKIGIIVGFFLLIIVLLAAIIGYFLDLIFPDLDIFKSNNWDTVNSKLTDKDYVKEKLDTVKNQIGMKSGNCQYKVGDKVYTNIKVRLYDNNFNLAYPDDTLIDFDKYILGVAYQEVGGGTDSNSEQVFKTAAIAARSYALTRGNRMSGVEKLRVTEENGYYIINLRQTSGDQAYCDPDEGYKASGMLSNCSLYHGKLSDDSPLRTWAKEVEGMVLVDSEGEVVYTEYTNVTQESWMNMSKTGATYDEMLFKTYDPNNNNGYTISANCSQSSVSAKDAETWKQCDSRWGSMLISDESLCTSGCAITAVAIQIARSGVAVNVSGEFNPGSFMQAHKSFGGFSGNSIVWDVSKVAPNLKIQASHESLSGTKEAKIAKLKEYANDGEFIVLGVRHGIGQNIGHYVAYNYSSSDEIYIFDPAGNTHGKLFYDYPAMANASTSFQVVRYKVVN